MKRVTTDEFISVISAALADGVDYAQATANLCLEGEDTRRRDREGKYVELLASEVSAPYVDYDDDGEAPDPADVLEWAEERAHEGGRYEAVGWTPPPRDPYIEMEHDVGEAVWRARKAVLHEAIQTLSKQEQVIIHAVFWDGASQAEVARGMRISRQAVNHAIHRAIDKLREFYGITPTQQRQVPTRLTQDQMDAVVMMRQRRRGAAVASRLRRIREGLG